MKFNRLSIALMAFILCASKFAVANEVEVNDVHITYGELSTPRCELFLRHPLGTLPQGYGSGYDWCRQYSNYKDDDVINSLSDPASASPVEVFKREYISLDEFMPWTGTPPIRARFSIGARHEDPDPDQTPSYLPYVSKNRVSDYILIDERGYEINPKNNARTGYRFYEFVGKCYLATITKPRVYKYSTACQLKKSYEGFPKSVDTSSLPWINIMTQNTVDLDERMPADSVEVPGVMPVKPLIYSDFPLTHDGKVSKGRAMCMADCASGMLMKLLHVGQSIWGPSGKPPVTRTHGTSQ